jgi:DNA-binding MarR family transcriptional regulator
MWLFIKIDINEVIIMLPNMLVLRTLAVSLKTFKEFTGDNDVQIQCVQVFLETAMGNSPSMDSLARTIGLEQSTASRNLKKLAVGPREHPGYGLIAISLDLHDMRRRILTLTARGHELVRAIEAATLPMMEAHFRNRGEPDHDPK